MGFYTRFDYLTDTVYEWGLGNFRYILCDENFRIAMKNTCWRKENRLDDGQAHDHAHTGGIVHMERIGVQDYYLSGSPSGN